MMDTVYALWLRSIKRYLRSKSRIIGSLGMPLFFLLIIGFGLNSILNIPGSSHNYIGFIIPGIIAMSVLFTSIFSGIQIIWDRQFGFLKETLVAPVSRIEIMLGQTVGGASTAIIQGVIILVISMLHWLKVFLQRNQTTRHVLGMTYQLMLKAERSSGVSFLPLLVQPRTVLETKFRLTKLD